MSWINTTDILTWSDVTMRRPGRRGDFKNVQFRPDQLSRGSLFVAIKHYQFDGANFINEAVKNGADGIVVEHGIEDKWKHLDSDITVFEVHDTHGFLRNAVKLRRQKTNFKVMAITGSLGKSSTQKIVVSLLKLKFKVEENGRNFNNFWGVIDTLLNASVQADWVVLEIGAQKPGEILKLFTVANANIVCLLNCDRVHEIANGDSIEAIIYNKLDAFRASPQAHWVINEKLLPELEKANLTSQSLTTFPDKKWPVQEFIDPAHAEHVQSAFTLASLAGLPSEEILKSLQGHLVSNGPGQIQVNGLQNPVLLDAFCTSAPAFKNLLVFIKRYLQMNADLKTVVGFLSGIQPPEEQSLLRMGSLDPEMIQLFKEIPWKHIVILGQSQMLIQLCQQAGVKFVIPMEASQITLQALDPQQVVVFQDHRSRWLFHLLKLVGLSQYTNSFFPPF